MRTTPWPLIPFLSPRLLRRAVALAPALLATSLSAHAQGTLDDYRRAATIGQRYAGLTVGVVDGSVTWLGNSSRFWYRVSVAGGHRFVVGDAEAWATRPAFDHERMATAVSQASSTTVSAITLPFTAVTMSVDLQQLEADVGEGRWRCTLTDYVCTRIGAATGTRRGNGQAAAPATGAARSAETVRVSPDGKWQAFILNANVAVRPVLAARANAAAGRTANGTTDTMPPAIQLSVDGAEGNAYQLPSIEWAPDSRRLVAYRRRAPGFDRLVHFVRSSPTDQLQPRYENTRTLSQGNANAVYRKPGDALDIHQPVLFDVVARTQVIVDNALFPNPYQISRAVWRKDGRAFTFEYNQRGHQVYRVLEVDGTTGKVRPLISEETKTFFAYRAPAPGLADAGKNWRFDIDDGRELLWMSERDGWNHLYLYDGVTGKVKQQVTKGPWVVRYVDSVDVANRQIYFRAAGRHADQDPYFTHFYRVNFDGTGLVAYTEANGMHELSWSPDRRYYVDTYSRVDLPPVLELRRVSDRKLLPLERGDMSAAVSAGFRPPEVFVAKGRDGVTDIWGIIVRPSTVDLSRKYPVLESIYAGPQGSFTPKTWGGGQAFQSIAELGFIVVQMDGMGTNNRSKAFHDVAWKNLGDAGFPDRIRWHQAVNAKYPYYDITRVGLYGTSAGGQNAMGGLLFHPEFYKAAFASSGCHDNRMDKIWWNEQWMGELGAHYAAASNVDNAYRLKGKLFLAVGELDTNVDPSSTLQVADALIRAHKDFELLVVPNGGHGATGPDGARRRNDFFVRSLLGVTPPDWNSGATLDTPNQGTRGNGGGSDPDAEAPPYGFFDGAPDLRPPYWWW